MKTRSLFTGTAFVLALAGAAVSGAALSSTAAIAASEVRVVVNNEPITSYQIRQRAAFLNLRRVGGDVNAKAVDELIDEALKNQEIRRRGINIPDEAVEGAFANFAEQNKLTLAQLNEVLGRAGFSADAFKDYIRTQMGWGQAVQMNMRRSEQLSEQDVVQRMLAQGGEKPSTTEYTLQQVIFVVPEANRGAADQRMTEANNMRARFQSCDNTFDVAAKLRDVTVRDLGRVAQPELPGLWKEDITGLTPGRTTPAKQTERGIEFIAVCDARTVSDDIAAGMVFQAQELEKLGEGEPDVAFLAELKEKAQITRP